MVLRQFSHNMNGTPPRARGAAPRARPRVAFMLCEFQVESLALSTPGDGKHTGLGL